MQEFLPRFLQHCGEVHMQWKNTLCKLLLFIALFSFVYSPIIFAQEEKIHQYKVEVKEKLLYVLALDKNGNPINDLKKDDFQLFVDGKVQQIKTFALITHEEKEYLEKKMEMPAVEKESPLFEIKEAKTNKRFILATIPPGFGSRYQHFRARKSLIHLIEQASYPDDWISVVVIYRDGIYSVQDFTNVKEKLLKKVDAAFKIGDEELRNLQRQYPLTDDEFYQLPQLPIFQGVITIKGGIDIIPSLELIAEKMATLKGRKIIFCLGLPLNFLGSNNRISAFFDMVNKMLTHNITIYYSELKGPHISGFFDASSSIKLSSNLLPGSMLYDPMDLAYKRFLHESSHFALANETGGKYYYNISSPTYFIDDVDKINSSYYLISFPVTIQLNKKKSLSIKLKCRREGVKLYYSNKYYAPHDLEDEKFEDTYQKIQLFKYLVVDTEQPTLHIEGKWIPLPGDEETLQFGFIDFYLPPGLFQQIPITYQVGASYAISQRRGIFFQTELEASSPQKNRGYRARALVKFTGEGKSLRLVAMDSESGEFGRLDIDISKPSSKADFSDILLGNLVDKERVQEFRDYSEDRYNLDKDLYKLLKVDDELLIPSTNNTFNQGEKIAFCMIYKIPKEQSKRYKNCKAFAYLAPDKEGQITEITLPVSSKKVAKHYRQYYGTIDTSDLTPGKYRIEIDLKDANNTPIIATDACFELIK
jgi:VWFA-related protein